MTGPRFATSFGVALGTLALTMNGAPLAAQASAPEAHHHGDHADADQAPAPATPKASDQPMDHAPMDQGHKDHAPPAAKEEQTAGHAKHGHGAHGGHAGHGAEGHGAHRPPIPQSPPPRDAFSGPLHAADALLDAEKMAASRAALAREISGPPLLWFQADRAEYRARAGGDGYLWDVQGFYGGDIDKFWYKSEGEGALGERPEQAEIQGLWSHAVDPWWDVQLGVRQDLVGPKRTHAVIGVQGLAPYLFEVDAAAFLSTKGDLTARIEAELDQRVTQRLILQPRAELRLAAQDIPEEGVGAGIDKLELGLRLRYEIRREFAPYLGIEQEWKLGASRDFARAAGEDPSVTNYVIGLRLWF